MFIFATSPVFRSYWCAVPPQIRGFINICRHRGHPVVMEAGNKSKLRCHFHAWTYGLDGKLRQAPRSAGDPTFDRAEFSLVAIQTHVWGPMIWANLDLTAPSFDEWISGMPQLLAERGLNVDEHTFGFDNTRAINSNWKVFQDNTIECYHCPTTHPELMPFPQRLGPSPPTTSH